MSQNDRRFSLISLIFKGVVFVVGGWIAVKCLFFGIAAGLVYLTYYLWQQDQVFFSCLAAVLSTGLLLRRK